MKAIAAAIKFPFLLVFTFTVSAWEIACSYATGLWFLFAHPHEFHEFLREYRRFREGIERADGIRNSEYFELNRAKRRKLDRFAAKKGIV